ncbi:zona pellucida sperm-binding protein 4-like [Lepisosteus oculatus]|uniref:zona pellucida sperm-binding protein 4-like n=1 Tax=Lepisosteus oculatus TaxID=7918 RepID=UPI0035F52212
MNACTRDGHFVFSISRDSVTPRVDPRSLRVGGRQRAGCRPVLLTRRVAVFKFGLRACGARVSGAGRTRVYTAEVRGTVPVAVGQYGQVGRVAPYRLRVQCSYAPGPTASAGFFVRSRPPPPDTVSTGELRVQIRVARSKCYSRYYPERQLPLRLSLKAPLFLEVRLVSPPDPSLVLLVHYCVAYPRSAQAAWVLIYDGCPNPRDPYPSTLHIPGSPSAQRRRFSIKTFQFVDPKTGHYLDEEVYILCATEVCSPSERNCSERCFRPPEPGMPVAGEDRDGGVTVRTGPFILPQEQGR